MKWFDNPRKRRTRKRKRKAPKGGWKKYMAKLRAMKGGKRRKRRSKRSTGGHMARRKRSHKKRINAPRRRGRRSRARAVVRINPRRRRNPARRHYRRHRNPRFSVGGVIARIKQGAVDGLWIVGGKAVTNALPSLIGLSPTGALGLAVKALSAVGAGYLFGMVSANAGKLATASGFASIYEPYIKGLNLPIISPALADDDYSAYPDVLASYPDELSSYPQGVGDEDMDYAMSSQY